MKNNQVETQQSKTDFHMNSPDVYISPSYMEINTPISELVAIYVCCNWSLFLAKDSQILR